MTITQVVTYNTLRGDAINLCEAHQAEYEANHDWPRNNWGEEYCQVMHGFHLGICTACPPDGEGK